MTETLILVDFHHPARGRYVHALWEENLKNFDLEYPNAKVFGYRKIGKDKKVIKYDRNH